MIVLRTNEPKKEIAGIKRRQLTLAEVLLLASLGLELHSRTSCH